MVDDGRRPREKTMVTPPIIRSSLFVYHRSSITFARAVKIQPKVDWWKRKDVGSEPAVDSDLIRFNRRLKSRGATGKVLTWCWKVAHWLANQTLNSHRESQNFQHSLCLVSSVGISPPDREAGGIPMLMPSKGLFSSQVSYQDSFSSHESCPERKPVYSQLGLFAMSCG